MITTLLNNLSTIYSEVMTKLIPENIKSGVNILNVTGTLSSGGNEKPYTELEYIESTGTQYIDMKLIPEAGMSWEIKITPTTQVNQHPCVFYSGNRYTSSDNTSYLLTLRPSDSANVRIGTHLYSINIPSEDVNTIVKKEGSTIIQDGITVVSNVSESSFSSTLSLALFAPNSGGTISPTYAYCGQLYYLKFWKNGTLVRDFIPVKDFNNVVCLYDKVSGRFFYNEGTGDFVAGPEINGYTELLYIQSSGTQYINTQETLTTDSKIEVTYLLDALTTGQGILGAGNWMTYADGLGGSSSTFGVFDKGTSTAVFTYNLSTNELMNVVITDDTITINNSQQTNLSLLSGMSASLGLLDNTYDERASAKIFSCKVYQNNVLTKDLIPVKRKSDNVICMYDRVTGAFYTNAGTGSFVAGPER